MPPPVDRDKKLEFVRRGGGGGTTSPNAPILLAPGFFLGPEPPEQEPPPSPRLRPPAPGARPARPPRRGALRSEAREAPSRLLASLPAPRGPPLAVRRFWAQNFARKFARSPLKLARASRETGVSSRHSPENIGRPSLSVCSMLWFMRTRNTAHTKARCCERRSPRRCGTAGCTTTGCRRSSSWRDWRPS